MIAVPPPEPLASACLPPWRQTKFASLPVQKDTAHGLLAQNHTQADLATDRMLNLALLHLLEIGGEAARKF